MSITGIVLNYNNYEETIECADSLLNLEILNHLIIVDNASTDLSYDQFKKHYHDNKRVVLLNSDVNGGYAAGNNIGIRYASETLKSELIFVCNPDVRIDSKDVIETLISVLESNDKIVAAAPKMLDRYGKKINNAWMIPTYCNDLVLSSIILTKLIGNRSNYKQSYFENVEQIDVEVLSGSCFAMKTSFISKVGYLDEGTFLYGEERILAKQIKELGYRQVLINNTYFHHYHSTTISKNIKTNLKRFKILSDSRYYYQSKYNNISMIKKIVLKAFIILGMIEQTFIQVYKRYFR